jgi:predicted small lipoprotein YifL
MQLSAGGALLFAILSLALTGCGKKGPPDPPPDVPNTFPRPYPSE